MLKLPINEIAQEIWKYNKVKEENFSNKKVSDIIEKNFANRKSFEFYVTESFKDSEDGGEVIDEELRVIFLSDGNNKFEIKFGKNNEIQNLIAKTFKFTN